uniref:Ig-like domain-containing protein n=1 Tax=Myripristis murdjan TaxID=586833 RepID=A0A667YYL9_9TELE
RIFFFFFFNQGPTTQGVVRKRSKIPGVMITQLVANIPAGKSTPDFQRKPITLTIQEGKLAVFKAVVTGDPKPQVNWTRAKGEISEDNRFQSKYDESSGEYTLEIHKVSGADADTYKCFATNEYGKAVCTATLNVIEGKSYNAATDPSEFRKLLRKSKVKEKPMKKEDGEVDERFWEIILNADRKDYERICAEYGVKDLRLILKKLEEKKQERVEEQNQYVEYLRNLRHIEVKGDGTASFEFEMELKDPTSRIFLYKDGVMIPYSDDTSQKHSLKTVGKKVVFSIKDLVPEDAGLYQVDVEEVNVFATEFRIPKVDFLVKIQEVKAKEREDAVFECALSHPLAKIKWMGKNSALEDGDKYSITVSDDKLIHRLVVKDCKQLDKGIYSAVAGIKSCSAWLVVEADSDSAAPGKKKAQKFVVTIPTKKECDLRCAPTFIVPLKLHTAPKGYECYMSCAVKGNPKPRITWYRNNISLNTNTNYYISNTCGVCSMLILRVGPKDMGEYTITAENALGRAECSTTLNVRGEREADLC